MKQLLSILCLTVLLAVTGTSCGDDKNDPELQQFTVTFDSQGGTKVASQTLSKGEKITEPTNPTKDRFAFTGWYTEASYTHIWNFEKDVVTNDITLYAKWEVAEFTVTFNTNGGSSISPQPIANGAKIQRPLPPTKDGFVFDNWYKDEALTQVYDFSTIVTGNITLYAKWTEAATITKGMLQALMEEAYAINTNKYTDESLARVYDKLRIAETIISKTNPTAQEIQTAYQELNTAISELEEAAYRATSGIEVYPEPINGFIYVNSKSDAPFGLSAFGVDSEGNTSTNSDVSFVYNGLEAWATGEIQSSERELYFTISPLLTAGSTITITVKSAEFPSISKTVTLKVPTANELKTLFINTVNALPAPDRITIDNFEEVDKNVSKAGNLYYSLSSEEQQEPDVVAAYNKLHEVVNVFADMQKMSYSFNGNLCTLTIYDDKMYANYEAAGAFPAGTYTMTEWERGENADKTGYIYENYKIVLNTNRTFDTYTRTSNNPNGSNPSNWSKDDDGSGTYTYTGSKATGGYLFMIYANHNSTFSLRSTSKFSQFKKQILK